MRGDILLLMTFYSKTFSGAVIEWIQKHTGSHHKVPHRYLTLSLSVNVEQTYFFLTCFCGYFLNLRLPPAFICPTLPASASFCRILLSQNRVGAITVMQKLRQNEWAAGGLQRALRKEECAVKSWAQWLSGQTPQSWECFREKWSWIWHSSSSTDRI